MSLTDDTVSAGRIYFSHRLTRDLVWRDEWRHHANGVIGVSRAVIAAVNPASVCAVFARMFGSDAVRDTVDGSSLAVGLSRFDVITPDARQNEFGKAAPDGGGRTQFMASPGLRTRSLRSVAAALAAGCVNGIQQSAGRLVVPASPAFGAPWELHESHYSRHNDGPAAAHSRLEYMHHADVLRVDARPMSNGIPARTDLPATRADLQRAMLH